MSFYCPVTKKKPLVGCNVSHAKNRTKRRYLPNLRSLTVYSVALKRGETVRITTKGLKTIFKYGGLDEYLRTVPLRALEGKLLSLRQELQRKSLL